MSVLTVTVKLQVLRFVQSSVAVQVTVVVPTGNWVPETGLQVTAGVEPKSVAVGAGKFTTAPDRSHVKTTMFDGH